MLLVYLLCLCVVFCWQIRSARTTKVSRLKALGRYAGYAMAPLLLYAAVFMGLVGIEELTGSAIVGEGYARSLPLLLGAGTAAALLSSLVFLLVLLILKPRPGSEG